MLRVAQFVATYVAVAAGICEDGSCKEAPVDLLQSRLKLRDVSDSHTYTYWPKVKCPGDGHTWGVSGTSAAGTVQWADVVNASHMCDTDEACGGFMHLPDHSKYHIRFFTTEYDGTEESGCWGTKSWVTYVKASAEPDWCVVDAQNYNVEFSENMRCKRSGQGGQIVDIADNEDTDDIQASLYACTKLCRENLMASDSPNKCCQYREDTGRCRWFSGEDVLWQEDNAANTENKRAGWMTNVSYDDCLR